MDLISFHRSWLGKDPQHTPAPYLITPRQIKLYESWPQARGTYSEKGDVDLFVATFILTLAQTKPGDNRKVFFLTPRSHAPWVREQMAILVRYLIRCRRRSPKGIQVVKDVVKQIYLSDKPFKFVDPPEHWVVFGFSAKGVMPPWIAESLVEIQ